MKVSQEIKIANLEHALELASRDAIEECDRARSAEARVQKLEEALREVQKRVESYDMYLADMEGKIDGGIREIRYIVDAVLASEAPSVLNARLYVRGRGKPKPYPLDEDEVGEAPEKEE